MRSALEGLLLAHIGSCRPRNYASELFRTSDFSKVLMADILGALFTDVLQVDLGNLSTAARRLPVCGRWSSCGRATGRRRADLPVAARWIKPAAGVPAGMRAPAKYESSMSKVHEYLEKPSRFSESYKITLRSVKVNVFFEPGKK